MPTLKKQKKPELDNDSTMLCECGATVNVGTGGEGNLRLHRKSVKHKNAMQKISPDEQAKKFKSFFSKPKPSAPPVPVPPRLSGSLIMSNPNVNDASSQITSPLLIRLKQTIGRLPSTVALGTADDVISSFVSPPALDPTLDDQWELFDPILNRFLGFGKSIQEIKSEIRRGPYGIDALYEWIRFCMEKGGIGEGLLEGKVTRLIEAMNELIAEIQPHSENASTMPATRISLSPELEIIDALLPATPTSLPTATRATREVIDIDATAVSSSTKKDSRIPCHGFKISAEPGHSLFSDYPFNLHALQSLPWSIHVKGDQFSLHATSCLEFCYADPCINCCALHNNSILSGILQRMSTGAKEHTPWRWLSHTQLEERAHRLERQVNAIKLTALSTGNKLARRTTVLEDHKRFMLSIATGKGQNIQRLVAVGLKNNMGIRGLIERIDRAAQDLYSVKSYEERDYQIALLLWRYGGARVAEIAHKALGLPCQETIRKSRVVAPLHVSPRFPTNGEIVSNLGLYDTSALNAAGCILMVDELATESRLRYDARNNTILGVCREHSRGYNFTFNGLEEADVLLQGLQDQKVHFASEATVLAIGSLHSAPRIRQALPVAISGTCKCESAEEHVRILEITIQACEQTLGRPIYCVASDGESKRGLALNHLTAISDLPISSPLFPVLGDLPLFDLKVGRNELTVDKDYKHIFKRFRNTIIRPKGILVDGTHITSQIWRQHLSDSISQSVEAKRLDAMLNPNDRQDVPLAISLLALVWNLPQPLTTDKPTYFTTRQKLNLFGEMVAAFLQPYLKPTMSLTEQLCSLSKAAHIAFALYILGGTKFLPTQLYADLQLAIKNVYFCVAKTQRDFPDQSFYITLLGTDCLETQFGNLRTIVGSDANVDLLQIGSRLTAAAECSGILFKHPEWDRGPRRLRIPSLDVGGMLSNTIDHLGPDHWEGDTKVSLVSLVTTWCKGQILAAQSLTTANVPFSFSDAAPASTITMLAPSGTGLFKRKFDLDEIDDEDTDTFGTLTTPTSLSPDQGAEPDIEDIVNVEASKSNHPHTVQVDGKPVHKASILRLYSHPSTHSGPKLTDRLRRVRGYKRFESAQASLTNPAFPESDSRTVFVNDPALTLIKVHDEVFLGAVQVIGFKVDNIETQSLPQLELKSNCKVFFQILKLVACDPTSDDPPCDWISDGSIVNYGSTSSILEARGDMVQVFNPIVSCREEKPLLYFSSTELAAITAILHQRLADLPDCHVPTANVHDIFPYRHNGKACFNCQQENDERLGIDNHLCMHCHPQVNPGTGAQLIIHNRTTEVQVNYKKSLCPKISKFSYKPASQYTPKNPCTNVPLACPLCPPKSPAVWRYNLKEHFRLSHADSLADDYNELWEITEDERQGMENHWNAMRNARTTRKKREKARYGQAALVISEGHTSRLTLRNTDLIQPASAGVTSSGIENLASSDIEVRAGTPHYPSSDDDASDAEYIPEDDSDQPADNTQGPFTEVAVSRRGRRTYQRITFFEEICDCGMDDKSVDIMTDEWKSNPELIECRAIGCETKAFHLNCQGLKSVPLNWVCRSCKSMNRKTVKRTRKNK